LASQTDPTRGPYVHTFGPSPFLLDRLNRLTITDFNPDSRNEQIGVTTVGTVPAFTVELARPAIDTDISKLINNASCDPATVFGIINPVLSDTKIQFTDTLVGSSGCQILTGFLDSGFHSEVLNIEITNLEDSRDAASIFEKRKSDLQRIVPADKIIPTVSVGDDVIRTAYNTTFRRNSLIIRVFTAATPDSDPQHIAGTLLHISHLLDTHIITHTLPAGSEARPTPSLREEPITSIRAKTRFSLHLDGLSNVSNVKIAEVEDRGVVLPVGPGGDDGKFEFYAMGEGTTVVRLCVADEKKLFVSATVVTIEVTE
jgi:hypothetical protein